jgi:hypothetical protein
MADLTEAFVAFPGPRDFLGCEHAPRLDDSYARARMPCLNEALNGSKMSESVGATARWETMPERPPASPARLATAGQQWAAFQPFWPCMWRFGRERPGEATKTLRLGN